jgi:hypothetical protein
VEDFSLANRLSDVLKMGHVKAPRNVCTTLPFPLGRYPHAGQICILLLEIDLMRKKWLENNAEM